MDHTLGPTDPSKKKKRVLSVAVQKKTEQSRQRTLLGPPFPVIPFLPHPIAIWPSRHVPESDTEPSSDTLT